MTFDDRGADSDRPTLRIRGPADIVQLVPYLLGFHPSQSLVILGVAQRAVVMTVRMDLADVVDERILRGTLGAMAGGGARTLVGVVMADDAVPATASGTPAALPDPLPWHGILDTLRTEAGAVDIEVDDVLLVSGGRWWSLCCDSRDCCPPEGTSVADADSTVPASAAFAGLVALADRGALAALLDPVSAAEREALGPALESAEAEIPDGREAIGAAARLKRALFAAARDTDPPAVGGPVSDADLARFGVALTRTLVRDAVWLAIDDNRLDGRELWRELGRRLPGRYAAAPLFLFGWANWRDGNGALAGMAVERALAADPDYSAADLLGAALAQGMNPRTMPRLRHRQRSA